VSLRVAPATDSDVAGWLDLAAEVSDLFGIDMPNDLMFRDSLRQNVARGTAFCVRIDGAIAGGMMFTAGRIGWLAVSKKYRRRGIGRALVAHAQAEGRDIRVTTFGNGHPHPDSQTARTLYNVLGFQTLTEVAAPGPDGTPREDLVWRP
jgi:GNAT superfamily N-acetyltransferase